MYKTVCHFIIVFFCCGTAWAQPLPVNRLANIHVLPKQSITCIYQDSLGFIWLGADAGLYRYDGQRVRHFVADLSNPNALVNNSIRQIISLSSEKLLVFTESGFSAFNTRTGKINSYLNGDAFSGAAKDETSKGVWVVSSKRNMYHIQAVAGRDTLVYTHRFTLPSYLAMNRLMAMLDYDEEHLLFGQGNGLFLLNKKNGRIVKTTLSHHITSLYRSQADGIIWAGTLNKGLFVIHPDEKTGNPIIQKQFHLGSQSDAAYDRVVAVVPKQASGELLVATPHYIYLFDEKKQTLKGLWPSEQSIFADNNILNLFVDNNNLTWVATLKGAWVVQSKKQIWEHFKLSIPGYTPLNNQATQLTTDSSQYLWILSRNDGLFRRNLADGKMVRIRYAHWQELNSIKYIGNNQLLLFQNNRVVQVSAQSDAFSDADTLILINTPGTVATCLFEYNPGVWWFGTWQSKILTKYMEKPDPSAEKALQKIMALLDTDPVVFIKRDRAARIWVGTRGNGIIMLDKTGKTHHYTKANKSGLVVDGVLCFLESKDGTIWVGSRGGGLYQYLPESDRFKAYGEPQGLMSNTVCSIQEDARGTIWCSTENGISRYLPGQLIAFKSYTYENGLVNAEFFYGAGTKDHQGIIYFGQHDGVTALLPHAQTARKNTPRVIITSLETSDAKESRIIKEYDLGDQKIRIPFQQNNLTIAFSALDFESPADIRFAYKLEGYDSEWQQTKAGVSQAQYSKLPSGNYMFLVQSSDTEGNWLGKPVELPITIRSNPLLSIEAAIVYCFLTVGFLVLGLLFWLRFRKAKMALLREQERQVSQRDYYSDLSHEIKNRLTLILGPLEQALSNKEINQGMLQRVYQNALRLKRLSEQVFDERSTEEGGFVLQVKEQELHPYFSDMKGSFDELASLREIQFSGHYSIFSGLGFFDKSVMDIILMNFLSNALKYTPSGGKVDFSVREEKNKDTGLRQLVISIEDTGMGIPQNELSRIFDRFYRASNAKNTQLENSKGIGLNLAERLVKLHHANLNISSEENSFTLVTLVLPIDRAAYNEYEKGNIGVAAFVQETGVTASVRNPIPDTPEPNQNKPIRFGKMLLVEDDPDIQQFLRESFELEFEVEIAGNGLEGFEKVKSFAPDIVISDLLMPDYDGLYLLSELKKDSATADIPIIIITAQYSDKQRLICFQQKADDFMEKPINTELLRWRVKNLLQNRETLRSKYKKVITIDTPIAELESPDEVFIQRFVEILEKNLDADWLNVDFFASELNMSRATFYRRFESVFNESPSNYVKVYRLKKAAQMLQQNKISVTEIAYKTGFRSPKYFRKCFEKEFGYLPQEYMQSSNALNESSS